LALSFERKEVWKRRLERIDNVVCVGILFAASMPAIVIMSLLALPLLPLFGLCLCMGAGAAPRFERSSKEVEAADTTRREHPHPPTATPHYA
jgi:hypothetical protein